VSQKLLATVSQDRRLNIYSIASGKPVRSYRPDPIEDPGFEGASTGGLIKVSLDSSGRFAVTAAADKCIRVFDIVTGSCVARVVGHSELITSVKFTPNFSRIISTGGDGCVLVWRCSSDMTKLMRDRKSSPATISSNQSDSGLKRLRALQDGALFSTDDDLADASSTLMTDTMPRFELNFREEDLPNWARRQGGGTPEPLDTTTKKPPLGRGAWAQVREFFEMAPFC
jgi:WD40 repeat protein